jgi:hypothetical protein
VDATELAAGGPTATMATHGGSSERVTQMVATGSSAELR